MDEEEFRKFLKDTKRTRPKPKSQIDHIQLLGEFLLKEREGRSLEEATQEDLKAFAVWEESSRPTTAQALVHGIRNYYRFLSKETMVRTAGELYAEYYEHQRQTSKRTWTDRWLIGMLEGSMNIWMKRLELSSCTSVVGRASTLLGIKQNSVSGRNSMSSERIWRPS